MDWIGRSKMDIMMAIVRRNLRHEDGFRGWCKDVYDHENGFELDADTAGRFRDEPSLYDNVC